MAGELSLAELCISSYKSIEFIASQQSQSQATQRIHSYGPMHLAGEEQESEHHLLGRPRLNVDLDDVEFLCSLKLNLTCFCYYGCEQMHIISAYDFLSS